MTDFRHMPGREILRRVERALRRIPIGTIDGIPKIEVARALRDMERSMDDSDKERWEPFRPASIPDLSGDDAHVNDLVRATGVSADIVREQLAFAASLQYWRNNLYQVAVRRLLNEAGPDLIHLSIKRLDQRAVRDWRHFQRIKNEIVGAEFEGVELYPAESRLVDTSTQYHLWVVHDPGFRFGFGFQERMVANIDGADGTGAIQRKTAP
jgi:hypothetical protein